ncbi:MAG TPA: glycoside hydrolase family 66 protein, partial [Pseudomonadales bacterium]|nr:glycoside hydrolase family 66 protein [Pseudomonadales bacterium]
SWTPPATDYQGYLVSVSIIDTNGDVVDSGSCAVDESSDWSKFPRYGYVAHYDAGLDTYHIMWELKNYHINGVEFYDWQWKHHLPYNPGATWPDVANRTIYRSTVTNLIAAAHFYNMMAMNYNSYGMAWANYLTDGSGVTLSMGIFSSSPASLGNQYGYSLPSTWATTNLYEMNNRDTNWQNYIYAREQAVFTNFAFDGWHIDCVGQDTAYDYNGNFFNLEDYNPEFINNAKAALGVRMTFNTVDAGGENQVAQNANVDFVYSELWGNNPNYISFNQRVNNVRSYCSKSLVMPAYMDTGLNSGYFNEPGVLLTDAAMFACGGAHLELGDGNDMLNNDYFPKDSNVLMTTSLMAAMRTYYDFLVGYENLLRGDTVSANNTVTIPEVTTSTNGSAGTVWVISKKTFGYNIIHLVNLLNNTSTAWNDYNGTCPAPPTLSNLTVKMYYSGSVGRGNLWCATPDTNFGAATQLNYTTGSDTGGHYINFTVPQLQYWDMIWLEINGTTSATNQIRAANYDSMSAIGTEATSDTGGGLDVCDVNNTNGDSYVAFNNIDFGTGPTSISVRVASAVAYGSVEFHLDSPTGMLIATVPVGNTGGWQSWQTLTASVSGASGVHRLFAVFKNAASNLNWFQFNSNNNALPAPWVTADIGTVGLTGGATWSGGTFTVTGSGADIENTADAFRYAYQPCGPNCELRARVVTLQNTNPWAKAGVMFRNDNSTGAMNAAVVATAGNGVEFQSRIATGGGTTSTVISGGTLPYWVRLVRSATNSFSGYYSADGTNWTQIGAGITIPMGASALTGLAVTAHNNTTNCTASFDNVSVNNAPSLAAVSNQTIVAGVTLVTTNSASDVDIPPQTLTFSLLDAPTNAAINTNSGVFTWRPTIVQSPSTQTVAVIVSDNGTPVMSATQNFIVTVIQPVRPALTETLMTNGQFEFLVNGDEGPDYTIQFSTNLVSWSLLATVGSPLLPFMWGDTNAIKFNSQFYRILLGP